MSKLKVTVPIEEITETVRGKKVGVLTNGSFWLEEAGESLAGIVKGAASETILLYAEHGIRGDEGPSSPAPAAFDEYTQCEVRGLYDFTATDKADTIRDLDLVMVGVHDIGTRHYSYKRTMCHLMELAAEAGKAVVVIDAPNPVGGDKVEGNLGDPAFFSEDPKLKKLMSYGYFAAPITYRHGMTMGELALLARDHLQLDLDLRIIKMRGWRRDMWWDDTGWPYIPFDPSITTADTALDFLCTGLFQGTTVSWGIGTADSFRVIGAPWIKDDRLLRAMQQRNLTGVAWTRAHFMPRWRDPGDKGVLWRRFCHEPCNGVRFHFTDRNAVCTAEVQLSLLVECLRLFPEEFDFMQEYSGLDYRLEDKQWARRLKAGEGVATILAEWQAMSKKFKESRIPYLLY